MITDISSNTDSSYTFTVKRISDLHKLLCCTDKKTINLFINEIRHTVYSYHSSQSAVKNNKKIKAYERFFVRLNDKNHQLARFTIELSDLVNEAPSELNEEAKKADRAIDSIHGNLIDLCLTIENLSKHKDSYYQDVLSTVQDIYNCYSKIFDTTPNCRTFDDEEEYPNDLTVADLIVPVLEELILENAHRCHKLLQKISK